jgi:hypothetical protein
MSGQSWVSNRGDKKGETNQDWTNTRRSISSSLSTVPWKGNTPAATSASYHGSYKLWCDHTERTHQADLVGLSEIVIIFMGIFAQGSVVHPRRDDGWYRTKAVSNPAEGKDVIMFQLIPLGEVVHRSLKMVSYYYYKCSRSYQPTLLTISLK